MATPTAQQPSLGSLIGPTIGATTSVVNPNEDALRKLLAILRLATSVGSYRYGSQPGAGAYLGGATGGLNLAGGLLGATQSPTAIGKASGGVGAALGATQLGAAAGVPAAKAALPYAGPALQGAGLGLSLADIAKNPNLSTAQKAGHANQAAGETAIAIGVPYGALAIAAKQLIGGLERSSSPQVSGLGKALAYPARPVEGLLAVLNGSKSPHAAGNMMVQQARNTPVLKSLINPVFDFFGLGTKPTAGTQFRTGLQQYFQQAGLPAFNRADPNIYNVDLSKFTPAQIAAAQAKANTIVPPNDPYNGQTVAILLNTGAV